MKRDELLDELDDGDWNYVSEREYNKKIMIIKISYVDKLVDFVLTKDRALYTYTDSKYFIRCVRPFNSCLTNLSTSAPIYDINSTYKQ